MEPLVWMLRRMRRFWKGKRHGQSWIGNRTRSKGTSSHWWNSSLEHASSTILASLTVLRMCVWHPRLTKLPRTWRHRTECSRTSVVRARQLLLHSQRPSNAQRMQALASKGQIHEPHRTVMVRKTPRNVSGLWTHLKITLIEALRCRAQALKAGLWGTKTKKEKRKLQHLAAKAQQDLQLNVKSQLLYTPPNKMKSRHPPESVSLQKLPPPA